jgi:copper/silver efflux system protein
VHVDSPGDGALRRKLTILASVIVLTATVYPAMRIGSEFMPTLTEGTLLYMLSTGIRTPIGIKMFGTDLKEMEKLARQIESVSSTFPARPRRSPNASRAVST